MRVAIAASTRKRSAIIRLHRERPSQPASQPAVLSSPMPAGLLDAAAADADAASSSSSPPSPSSASSSLTAIAGAQTCDSAADSRQKKEQKNIKKGATRGTMVVVALEQSLPREYQGDRMLCSHTASSARLGKTRRTGLSLAERNRDTRRP